MRSADAPRALFKKLADACKAPAVALAAVESGLLTDIVCWMCKVLEEQGHGGAQVGVLCWSVSPLGSCALHAGACAQSGLLTTTNYHGHPTSRPPRVQDARFVAAAQAHAGALVQCCCAAVDSVAGTDFLEHQERINASIRSGLVARSQASGARPSAVAIGTSAWRERRDQLLLRMRHAVRSVRRWVFVKHSGTLQPALVLGRTGSSGGDSSGGDCGVLPSVRGSAAVPAAAVEREWAMAVAGCANPLCCGKEDAGGFSLPASLPVCGACGVARRCG